MWIITTFDLPMISSDDKKSYNKFRKLILRKGFTALQKSVYVKYCSSSSRTNTVVTYLLQNLPPKGKVTVFTLTSKSFALQHFYEDNKNSFPPKPPEQFLIFDN